MSTYNLRKSDGTILTSITDGSFETDHSSLTFVGKNTPEYGVPQNKNFLFLLENFASPAQPVNPLTGQLWFNTANNRLNVRAYDATTSSFRWDRLPSVITANTATRQTTGDFWFNTVSNQLYVKTDSSYSLIGPKSSVSTADTLTSPVTINGVSFNGSSNITVTSTTTYALSTGSFINGTTFNGSSTATWSVNTGVAGVATPNSVVARNAVGDIWYAVGHGVSSSARYADLAEKYLADKEYEVGTVMVVNELDVSEVRSSNIGERAIGVVSANPAYLMNTDLEGGTAIALKGRVPVKVFGPIKKGDRLEAFSKGMATKASENSTNVFAIALESNTDDNLRINLIESVIL
jgi:hypothetical protein